MAQSQRRLLNKSNPFDDTIVPKYIIGGASYFSCKMIWSFTKNRLLVLSLQWYQCHRFLLCITITKSMCSTGGPSILISNINRYKIKKLFLIVWVAEYRTLGNKRTELWPKQNKPIINYIFFYQILSLVIGYASNL